MIDILRPWTWDHLWAMGPWCISERTTAYLCLASLWCRWLSECPAHRRCQGVWQSRTCSGSSPSPPSTVQPLMAAWMYPPWTSNRRAHVSCACKRSSEEKRRQHVTLDPSKAKLTLNNFFLLPSSWIPGKWFAFTVSSKSWKWRDIHPSQTCPEWTFSVNGRFSIWGKCQKTLF